jgi:hypothetical protein
MQIDCTTSQSAAQVLNLLTAVNAGIGRLRDLQIASGYGSTSVVKYYLQRLADAGHLVLLRTRKGSAVYTGKECASAWDAAARLVGNPDA